MQQNIQIELEFSSTPAGETAEREAKRESLQTMPATPAASFKQPYQNCPTEFLSTSDLVRAQPDRVLTLAGSKPLRATRSLQLLTLLNCYFQNIAHRFRALTDEFFERGVDPAELSSPARLIVSERDPHKRLRQPALSCLFFERFIA